MRALILVAAALNASPVLANNAAAAGEVKVSGTPGNTGAAGAGSVRVVAPGAANVSLSGASLTPTTFNAAPRPTLDPTNAANSMAAPDAVGARQQPGTFAPPAAADVRRNAPSSLAAPDAAPLSLGARLDGAPDKAAPRGAAAPAAGAALGEATRSIAAGVKADAAVADGTALRGALDKAFDSMTAGGALTGVNAVTRNAVAGKAQDVRGRIDQTLAIARSAPPADAPDHYKTAVKIAEDSLPASAAQAVAAAVKTFARAKAEKALPELAAAAYSAAAGGLTGETTRLLKGFDKWEGLLGAAGRPLVSNADMLKADVRRRLDAAAAGGSTGSVPNVWFQKRGDSYVAALPGSAVAKIAPQSLDFKLSPSAVPGAAALAANWRAFAADPRAARGFAEVYKGRLTRGASVPAAALAASRFWLRAVLSRFWRGLLSLFASSAYDLAAPAGRESLKSDLASLDAVSAEGAAVRSALDGGAPTVGAARAALAALSRQAAAHERLRGSGAVAAASALASYFAAASAGLPDSEPLGPGLAELVYGADGVHRQSSRLAADAAAHVDGRVFAASRGGEFSHAEGSRRWAERGGVRLSADVRSVGAGGFIDLRAPGDAGTAERLAGLGFAARHARGVVTASYDADSTQTSAASLQRLADDALAAASGTSAVPAAALRSLVASVSADPAAAAKRARSLDGRIASGRLLGRVTYGGDEYDAVSDGGKLFLRSADGLAAFAAP